MAQSISMLSTYPPTRCGIATFAQSLADALAFQGVDVRIAALTNGVDGIPASDGQESEDSIVCHQHQGPSDTRATARELNSADVAVIQHEFGIFDGPDGDEVLAIAERLGVPIITVIHTAPAAPRSSQRRILQRLLDISDAVVALSYSAARVLRRGYEVRPRSLHVIPHGTLDLWHRRRQAIPAATPRLLTWGLIGRGKGLEWMLQALALADDLDPLPEYIIAGTTHPKVHQDEGDGYLDELRDLGESLGVSERVRFVDTYLDPPRLASLVAEADAFVLPYDNDEQVTSGVLVEALAAGGPVISTRFPHARELLGTGGGLLVNRRNPHQLADAIRIVVNDAARNRVMRDVAIATSRNFLWHRVAEQYIALADELTTFDENRLRPRPIVRIPAATAARS